jgi:pantoate--beta-alanine ligase
MKHISTIKELQETLSPMHVSKDSIGLVPTMGALHQGHLSLVEKSLESCDYTVVSVFINPTQFNNSADLDKYPKTLDKDLELLKAQGCDVVFTPSVEEMYPDKPATFKLNFGPLESILEGEHRPGHFQGVGIVVNKFFEIVNPTHAFFGQKDLQQYFIIKNIILSQNLPVELIQVPITRETSGLAMSSRNERLNPNERINAAIIFQSLQKSKDDLLNGMAFNEVKKGTTTLFKEQEGMHLEYFELIDTENFSKATTLNHGEMALCIAVNVGDVRLIDNLLIFS